MLHTPDSLFESLVFNICQLGAFLEVPCRLVVRYVERLEKIDILREVTGQARNRLRRADEIVQVLNPGMKGL